jgi:hypothetical protein
MGDEEWQRRQDVLEGKRRNSDPPASNVKSTDHTGDAKKSSDDRGKGTDPSR